MSDRQNTFWLGAAFVVVIAICGAILWQVASSPTGAELKALNGKIEETNAALAQVQKATASGAITDGLAQLDGKIKATNNALSAIQTAVNDSLAELKKALPAGDVGAKFAALSGEIKTIDGKLADLQKAAALKGVSDQLDQLGANLKSVDSTLSDFKRALLNQNLASQIDALNDKIESLNGTLVEAQKATSLDVKKELASLNSKMKGEFQMASASRGQATGALQNTIDSLKKGIDDIATLRAKLADDLGKIDSAMKPQPKNAVVVYLHMPKSNNLPKNVAPVSPLSIEFQKIGSADDSGQAAMIIPKLKGIVEGRTGCTISVAGFADTLGGDQVNLEISQKRARNIAQKIKTAFAGSGVQVNEAAWGERRLKDWTPDGTANESNRRVDIAVNCKK
jgi:predicted  nucleic acid-binding Zn-ribbon protein